MVRELDVRRVANEMSATIQLVQIVWNISALTQAQTNYVLIFILHTNAVQMEIFLFVWAELPEHFWDQMVWSKAHKQT